MIPQLEKVMTKKVLRSFRKDIRSAPKQFRNLLERLFLAAQEGHCARELMALKDYLKVRA